MGPFMGLSFFMGVTGNALYPDSLYRIKKADEKQWVRSVINGGKVVNAPIEKQIKCPEEYQTFDDRTIERAMKKHQQHVDFIASRLNGLHAGAMRFVARGQEIPKSLLEARKNYFTAFIKAGGYKPSSMVKEEHNVVSGESGKSGTVECDAELSSTESC